jgi:hypothetical protein
MPLVPEGLIFAVDSAAVLCHHLGIETTHRERRNHMPFVKGSEHRFAMRGADRTPTFPDRWYNTKDGIARSAKTLAGLNALFSARRDAGYCRNERLAEFVVLGMWYLDTCGNAMKAMSDARDFNVTPRKAFTDAGMAIPDAIGMDEMHAALKPHYAEDKYPHMSFAAGSDLPQAYFLCAGCGRPWTIADCDDAVCEREEEVAKAEGCAGMTLGDFRRSFDGRNDALFVFQPELAVRNDRFIDLSPKYPGTDKDWEKGVPKNEHGWKSEGELSASMDAGEIHAPASSQPNVDTYVLQPGDEVLVNVFRYSHRACLQAKVDRAAMAAFAKAFEDAGLRTGIGLVEVENEYGSRSYRGPWYVAMTEIGEVRVGWRKRVIEVVFPDWVPVGTLFAKEDVTKSAHLIHAWGYDKLAEYLKAAKKAAKEARKT